MCQQRRGLLGVHVKTLGDGFRGVVGAAFDFGALLHTLHEHVVICIQCDDRVKRGVQLAQDGVESLDLGGVARIAIENPAVLGVVHGQDGP